MGGAIDRAVEQHGDRDDQVTDWRAQRGEEAVIGDRGQVLRVDERGRQREIDRLRGAARRQEATNQVHPRRGARGIGEAVAHQIDLRRRQQQPGVHLAQLHAGQPRIDGRQLGARAATGDQADQQRALHCDRLTTNE